ncbi:MAG: MBL fold metallo-hydrolase [Lachnospiraceae bacterium]|nr:MBL fold metallo-hydrolase [Lachnospiraceae bacterium]
MRLMTFASGSSGNCTYIGEGDTHILVDAGISCKRIMAGLARVGLTPADLTAVLITHEHIDHVAGLAVLRKKTGAAIVSAAETLEWLRRHGLEDIGPERLLAVREDVPVRIGGLRVTPLRISHDAVHPLGYRIDGAESSAAVITDLGYTEPYLAQNLQGLSAIVLEANHDVHMLQAGPYPYQLKRRILGDGGHLSNEACGQLLSDIVSEKLRYCVLGHLSQENNLPELAYEAVRLEVDLGENTFRAGDFALRVAPRETESELFEF